MTQEDKENDLRKASAKKDDMAKNEPAGEIFVNK